MKLSQVLLFATFITLVLVGPIPRACAQLDALGNWRFPDADGAVSAQLTSRRTMSDELALQILDRALMDSGDPAVSRETLLDRFRTCVEQYPNSPYAGQASEAVRILRMMVDEDRAHAMLALKPLEQMTVPERVEELIFQLREQNGHKYIHPGDVDVFMDPRREQSPASQLVKIGLPAVPQLIQHLNDRRFTRSVATWQNLATHRSYVSSGHVTCVGDVVERIIERLANRRFYIQGHGYVDLNIDGVGAQVKPEIQSWWSQIQRQGERSVLIAGVERGDSESGTQADALVEKYPEAALHPISVGLQWAAEGWIRDDLIRAVGQLKDPSVATLLKEQLERGPDLETRVASAFWLWQLGDDDAITRMIRDWQHLPPGSQVHMEVDNLIRFLAHSGKVGAINALAANLGQRPVKLSSEAILSFTEASPWPWASDGKNLPHADDEALVVRAQERLLAHELLDTEHVSLGMHSGDTEFTNPRLCELAGFVLAEKWPS